VKPKAVGRLSAFIDDHNCSKELSINICIFVHTYVKKQFKQMISNQ